ncbi:hypothetical protein PIB30_100332, partial [Stylosanthes scabra]|nr:hypothetical protein [Stylosanthes scabra]
LNGLALTTRDTHARRQLEFRNELNRISVNDFVWTPYIAPQWCAIDPAWVNEAGEIQTWLATVPIILFMYVRFHHADRVKRQFGGEQPVPVPPVNLDGFLGATARGDDKWWPDELAYWYDFWRNRMSRDHQIQIVPTRHPGDFSFREICPQLRRRREIRSCFRAMPQPADAERECSGLISGGRVRGQQAVGGRIRSRAGTMRTRRRSTLDKRTFRGGRDQDPGGDGPGTHDTDLDFFSGANIELARFMEYGGGSGAGSGSQPGDGVPPSHRYAPPSDMYELFSCGEQTMDQIAHSYVASRPTDDAVYRPSPPAASP